MTIQIVPCTKILINKEKRTNDSAVEFAHDPNIQFRLQFFHKIYLIKNTFSNLFFVTKYTDSMIF